MMEPRRSATSSPVRRATLLPLLLSSVLAGATAPEAAAGDGGPCVPGPSTLCLLGDRFRVEATWQVSPSGPTGLARGEELTGDTGYFWFFDPENVELVVKVLDACDLPGFNNFWVFAAGLTDVEVTLTVTDTESDQTKEYFSPLGTPFPPIQDTGAFDTCP